MTNRVVGGAAGLVLVVAGLSVAWGWHAGSVMLVQIRSDWAPMPFNEALCFALLGLALVAGALGARRACAVCGALVAAIAAATFAQYLFALELGIDQLFVDGWARAPLTRRGRMPPNSAALFILVGAVLVPDWRDRWRGAAATGAWAAGLIVAGVAIVYALAYLPSLKGLATSLGWASTALHSCGLFVVAGVGLVALAGPWISAADETARSRRWTTLLFMLVAVAGVNLWQTLVSTELTSAGVDAGQAGRSLGNVLYDTHLERQAALARISEQLSRGHELHEHALAETSGARWVAMFDADGAVLAAVGEARPSVDLVGLRRALETMQPQVTADQLLTPFIAASGPAVLAASIDYTDAFETQLEWAVPGYSFEVSIADQVVFERKPKGERPVYHPFARFAIPEAAITPRWSGVIWRDAHAVEGHRGILPLAVLLLSFVAAGLVALAYRTAGRLRGQLAIDRAIWRNSRDILCAVDADGRFVRVSDAAREIWGYEPHELIGKSHLMVSVPEARDEAAEIVADRREVQRYQSLALHRDGHTIPMHWSTVWSEELGVIIAIGRDITEQVEHEAELEQRVAERTHELTMVNAELEAFSYSVSHDLRTPLRAVAGFTELLQEELDSKLDETARHYLKRVTDAVERMGMLIDDLLRLGRLSRRDLVAQTVDMSALATRVATRLKEAEPARAVEFRIEPGMSAEADPQLAEILLENLFGNAMKFTREQERAVIEFDQEGGVFRLRDNGVGFDMQYADSLFGVFQRLHHLHEYPGTGVGLATVKRVVERHGGRVWAYGEVGQGASFFFSFG